MDEKLIIEDLKNFITGNILAPGVRLDADSILQSAGIDSFSLVEILLFIQEKYRVQVPDDQMLPENFRSLATLARMVQHLSVPR